MRRRSFFPLGLAPLAAAPPETPLTTFAAAASQDPKIFQPAFDRLKAAWLPAYAAMIFEMSYIFRNELLVRKRLLHFLEQRTRQSLGDDLVAWQKYLWSLPYAPHPEYAQFKGQLYAYLDPRMQSFFPPDRPTASRIRLDQVQWGGVRVNGIPPLEKPAMLPATQATYLKDPHVVFGVEIKGDARAYPKRILAWHEMANDTVGGENICLVYCTLCGTVIPYYAGAHHFGTSGLLFESSKLMFDEKTKSLWSTLQGQPVIGPLANSGIQLDFANVVTTTWGEWRAQHPTTSVLSLETGHQRDYGEGAAYRGYFASDDLMFEVSRTDRRLRKKDEILAIRIPGAPPLAIAVPHLRKNPHFSVTHAGHAVRIESLPGGTHSVQVDGQPFPAHRAFWFGWFTQFPDTVLIR